MDKYDRGYEVNVNNIIFFEKFKKDDFFTVNEENAKEM